MEINQQKYYLARKNKERVFLAAMRACAFFSVLPLIFLVSYVFFRGIGAINLSFFLNLPAPVGTSGGGMANAIVGTLMIVMIGCFFSLPVGVLAGIWLAEWGKGWVGFLVRYCVDILAGIPSIVLGIFAYVLIVLPMHRFSALAGGFAVSLVMLPYITRTTEEMVRLVPRTLREAGLALGLPEWKVAWFIVLRTAWSGIFTGIMLAVARAAGETAPLLFTAFSSLYWNLRIDQPTASMTVQIYNFAISPYEEWQQMAWAGSLTLMAIVLIITIVVRKNSKRVSYG